MAAELAASGVPYMRRISRLTTELARPWHRHPGYGDGPHLAGAGEGWHRHYPSFDLA